MNRIAKKFQELKSQNQCAFVAYICAGDPDYSTSLSCLKNLEKNGENKNSIEELTRLFRLVTSERVGTCEFMHYQKL